MRATVRMSPLLRSSPADEMAIWFVGGGVAFARWMMMPPVGGDALLFDMFSSVREGLER